MVKQLLDIAITDLMPDPSQPRKVFLDEEISRLASSIASRGLLHPLRVVRDETRQAWLILTGESRWRASKLAGLETLPCLVVDSKELSEADILADRLIENSVRHDLQPLDEAMAIARLKALKGCNGKTLVAEYGFTGASITRAESLLRLPPEIQQMIGTGPGQIAPSAAYELSRIEEPQAQMLLAQAVAGGRLNRDGVAEEVRNRVGRRKSAKPKGSKLPLRLDGGIQLTVSGNQPLTWETLLAALDFVRKQAKKLNDEGKDLSALARQLRSSKGYASD